MKILYSALNEIYKGGVLGGQMLLLVVVALSWLVVILFGIFGFFITTMVYLKDGNVFAAIGMFIVTVTVWGIMMNNSEKISNFLDKVPHYKIFKGVE